MSQAAASAAPGRARRGATLVDSHLRSDETLQDAVLQGTALRRLATPEDIGQLIAGLTTASGDWVTGQRIEASGGVRL